MVSLYKQTEQVVLEFASKYNLAVRKGKMGNTFWLYREWQLDNERRKRKSIYVKILRNTVFVAGYTNTRKVTHWDWMQDYIEHYRNSVTLQELWDELEKVYRIVFA